MKKRPCHLRYSVCYGETRDMMRTHCNYEEFLLAVIRRNGKGHLFLSGWLCFLICICVPHRLICIQQVTQGSHLGCRCIVEMHIILNTVNNPWCSIDSGALLFPANIKYILSFPPQIHFWHGFVSSTHSVPQTTFLPMFPHISKRRMLNFWNKQFLSRESQGCTHIKAK